MVALNTAKLHLNDMKISSLVNQFSK